MDSSRIRQIAHKFRAAIESTDTEVRSPAMPSFPTGACGVSSALLGAYFEDCGVLGFRWISGVRASSDPDHWDTHVWLQRNSLVVDITADQFPDARPSVIVDGQSTWHQIFENRTCREADFRKWDWSEPEYELLYTRLVATLEPAQVDTNAG